MHCYLLRFKINNNCLVFYIRDEMTKANSLGRHRRMNITSFSGDSFLYNKMRNNHFMNFNENVTTSRVNWKARGVHVSGEEENWVIAMTLATWTPHILSSHTQFIRFTVSHSPNQKHWNNLLRKPNVWVMKAFSFIDKLTHDFTLLPTSPRMGSF